MGVSELIRDLRSKIGHSLLWLPAVTAVVFDSEDRRVLLVYRSDNHRWTPVTGIVHPGEQPAAAAIREVNEETRVVARAERLVSVRAMPPTQHLNGDWAQYLRQLADHRPGRSRLQRFRTRKRPSTRPIFRERCPSTGPASQVAVQSPPGTINHARHHACVVPGDTDAAGHPVAASAHAAGSAVSGADQ